MSQWQYRTIDLNDLPARIDEVMILSEAGAQGWELVTILGNRIAYMKRQIEKPAPMPDAKSFAYASRRKAALSAK